MLLPNESQRGPKTRTREALMCDVAWDRRRYLPPYGERFIEQLCAATAKTYPGRRLGMTPAIPRPARDSEPFGRPPRVAPVKVSGAGPNGDVLGLNLEEKSTDL